MVLGMCASGLGQYDKTGRFQVQSPLGTWPGLGNQACYKAPCDLQVETE